MEEEVSVTESGKVFTGLRMLGRAGAPVDTLGEVTLAVLDPGRGEFELHAAMHAVRGVGRGVQSVEPALVPAERLQVASGPLAHDSLLAHQPRLRRLVVRQPAGACIRHHGLFVSGCELADVPEGLGDAGDL